MCDASAAVSVDTKSSDGLVRIVGLVKVVMVCSGCVKGGNFTALYQVTEIARFSLALILRKYPRFSHQTLLFLM